MKKLLVMLLILSALCMANVALAAKAELVMPAGSLKISALKLNKADGLYYNKKVNKPYTGIVVDTYGHKQLKMQGNLVDGRPEGLARYFDKKGNVTIEKHYKNGKLNGTNKYYNLKKHYLEMEETFVNGLQEGWHREYFPNGQVSCEIPYKNNMVNGTVHFYNEAGKITSQQTFKDDCLVGE